MTVPNRTTLILAMSALFSSFLSPCPGIERSEEGSGDVQDAPRIVNIINFIRLCEPRDDRITEDVLYQTVVKQVDLLRRHRLGGTFLLQYDALLDARYQRC